MKEYETGLNYNPHLTPEVFNSIISDNLSLVVLSSDCPQDGNLKRLEDKPREDFDPYNPSTWREGRVKQYMIMINDNLSPDKRAKSFLKNILRLNFDLQSENSGPVSLGDAGRFYQEYSTAVDFETERFYAFHKKELLKVLDLLV